jgi:hypothetical protein
MYCANHPKVETELACGRCDTPVCTRCVVHTEVGIRCRRCCSDRQERPHLLLGALLGLGVIGFLVSVVVVPQVLNLKPDVHSSGLPRTSSMPTPVTMPTSPPVAPASSYDLVIVTSTCTRDGHSATCTGSVKNVSGHNLQQVQVVVEQATDDGTIQTSNAGPIDYDPLLPDQESPWTLHPAFNPALTKYMIAFRTATGQPLLSRKETP